MIDSPLDEFVAFLNAELESTEEEEKDENKEYEETELYGRNKRQKVDALEFAGDKHELIDYQGLGQTPDSLRDSLFRFDQIQLMTKLRPFVHSFLKEASNLFEMYIYTMGDRSYALKMAKLRDPRDVYFHSRVIAQGDSTQKHQKDLDVVMGKDSAVLILDDTEAVWSKHKENLILMERYHFFASSSRQFGSEHRFLSELKSDENKMGGTLSSVLSVLQRIHSMFFKLEPKQNLCDRDVRQVLKTVRKEVLVGCKIVFSLVFPTNYQAEKHHLWKMAEQLGAKCSKECELSVTHVVSLVAGTEKSLWAVRERKFLVNPEWIKAANYRWRKPPEEFSVSM